METNKVLFSIITIAYNSAQTIERTILSIVNQSIGVEQLEYIIIDGGSTDETVNIIKKYESKFPHLIWVSEKDKGIYDGMNKGINKSHGKIIGIVNSDDWLEPNALCIIKQEYNQSKNKRTIYTGSLYFHYTNGTKQHLVINEEYFNRKKKKYIMPVRHPATFVPKDIYKEIGLFDIKFKIEADCDFIYRCIDNNIKFRFISEPLSNMSDGGVSNNSKYIKRCLNDRALFYEKRNFHKFKKMYYIVTYSLRLFVKIIFGKYFIRLYRNNN